MDGYLVCKAVMDGSLWVCKAVIDGIFQLCKTIQCITKMLHARARAVING